MIEKWMEAISWKALTRRRVEEDQPVDSKHGLSRVMGIFDLTLLGVGATLGLGPFVLAGEVAKDDAGPATCISFIIAAFAAAFSALCYAEFSARVPKAGSAYVYSYVTIGEFIAFVIGWNLILEYAIGVASIGAGLTDYIDYLAHHAISHAMNQTMPMHAHFLASYPDFFAFGVIMAMSALLLLRVSESSIVNNVLTMISLLSIVIIIIAGATKANLQNWKNFFPNHMKGVFRGAAKCFYAFVGFDAVTTCAEEAKNPKRNIPLAIVFSFAIIFIANFGVSAVLTLMCLYSEIDKNAPFPYVFEKHNMQAISYIASIGAISALLVSIMGMMFPLPRILYSMGTDGVIFTFFSRVNEKTKTPIYGTVVGALLSATMALLFTATQLMNMLSIGTLLAYTIVAVCVIVLKYSEQTEDDGDVSDMTQNTSLNATRLIKAIVNWEQSAKPTALSRKITQSIMLFYCAIVLIFGGLLHYGLEDKRNVAVEIYVGLAVIGFLMIIVMIIVSRQPVEKIKLSFRVPWVPAIPCVCIFLNLFLMVQLDVHTWIRLVVWLAIGLSIYLTYGITHSTQGERDRRKHIPKETRTIEVIDVREIGI